MHVNNNIKDRKRRLYDEQVRGEFDKSKSVGVLEIRREQNARRQAGVESNFNKEQSMKFGRSNSVSSNQEFILDGPVERYLVGRRSHTFIEEPSSMRAI